jgi:hypothetical protein
MLAWQQLQEPCYHAANDRNEGAKLTLRKDSRVSAKGRKRPRRELRRMNYRHISQVSSKTFISRT